MSIYSDKFKETLERKDFQFDYYEATEKRDEAIKVSIRGEKADSIETIFFFDKDDETGSGSVNVKSFTIAKVPAEKLMDMYVTLNDLNSHYRWIKFYIDKDNEVTASGDAIIDAQTAGEECFEIMCRYMGIIDDIYPTLMKVIWA